MYETMNFLNVDVVESAIYLLGALLAGVVVLKAYVAYNAAK
jgi:hypothetical protein